MPSFQTDLDALAAVHAALLVALAETDVERIEPLVAQRGDLLASLAVTFAGASRREQGIWQPAVASLAREDHELTACFVRVRDQLAAELARASAHANPSPPEPTSGGLNLHA